MEKALLELITQQGDQGVLLPFARLADLAADTLRLTQSGDYLTGGIDWMATDPQRFLPVDLPFAPASLLMVATPSPRARLRFGWQGRVIESIMPPTYADMDKDAGILRYLTAFFGEHGHRVTPAGKVPLKMLAVRSGLAQYGRNFICYNTRFGSYMLLSCFLTDLPTQNPVWEPLTFMDSCQACHACENACPTGALRRERGMIDANRCVTYHNEKRGPFPDWLPRSAHSCVVGCMACQGVCPHNVKNRNNMIESVTFTEAETEEILTRKAGEAYTDDVRRKLEAAGLWQYEDLLPRNLGVLVG